MYLANISLKNAIFPITSYKRGENSTNQSHFLLKTCIIQRNFVELTLSLQKDATILVFLRLNKNATITVQATMKNIYSEKSERESLFRLRRENDLL